MTTHANDVTVGGYIVGTVTIKVTGPLAQYINGMQRYIVRVEGVKTVTIVDGEAIIIVTCKPTTIPDDTPEQVRIRIRNHIRDWFHDVTGYMTNIGITGSYVDLIEEAQAAA